MTCLTACGIAYFRVDHDHADTIEACEAVEQVLGEKICKNLFLCNRQKTQFYLLMLEGEKVFKTKDLSKQLGVARLSFADPADMEKYLDITPGSVSVLGLMNDPDNAVQLVIDQPHRRVRLASAATRASTPPPSPSPRRTSSKNSSPPSTIPPSSSTFRTRSNLSASLRSAPPLHKGRLFYARTQGSPCQGELFYARTQGSPCQGELARSA